MEVVDADANAGHAKACALSRVPDDDDTDAGQVPHRWTPPMQMPIPMLARCRIDGRRRCSCRYRCWPGAASMDAADAVADADAGQVPHRWTPPTKTGR